MKSKATEREGVGAGRERAEDSCLAKRMEGREGGQIMQHDLSSPSFKLPSPSTITPTCFINATAYLH
ncbi:hypothetical protein L6452_22500 [Arctium lappa]|uniref:Uncharacterized protein n=1 Tax=Arctium lappa TaxID=4217 RepID=A0ACB9B0L9_ARCLA|nr:hypothetical protein L6452_22500 [Arctium lappa]